MHIFGLSEEKQPFERVALTLRLTYGTPLLLQKEMIPPTFRKVFDHSLEKLLVKEITFY